MDACKYCKEHHNPYAICDGYIEAVEKGIIKAVALDPKVLNEKPKKATEVLEDEK